MELKLETPETITESRFWSCINSCLDYGHRPREDNSPEPERPDSITSLLDEMDRVAQFIASFRRQQDGQSLVQRRWREKDHVTPLVGMYPISDFLTFAVQCGLDR